MDLQAQVIGRSAAFPLNRGEEKESFITPVLY